MSRGFLRATAVGVVLVTAIPLALLFLPLNQLAVTASFAPCHQDVPESDTPAVPNHDCCLIGHNHAAPAQAADFPALQFVVVAELTPASSPLPIKARPEPALTSFDPPSTAPLRI